MQKGQEASPKNNFRITNYAGFIKMKSKEITKAKSPDIERKEEKERERETGFTLRDFKNNIEDFEIREVLGILIYNMKNILGKLFLGQGSYASVRLGVLKETKKKYAIKIYDKSKLLDAQRARNVKREITILQAICHENVIKLYQTIDTSKWVKKNYSL